jgi:hypothetical protein
MPDDKRQTVFVPITGGLGTDADPRMRAPERLQVARNCRSPEIGTLGKRYGFKPLTAQIAGGGGAVISGNGPIRGLMATNKELLALGHRNLYAWNSSLTGWVDRGHISPCLGDTQEVYRANVQYEMADGDRYANVVIYTAVRLENWGDGVSRRSLEFRGVDVNGDTIFAPAIAERTITTSPHPYSCRVCANGFGATIVWAQGDPGGAGPDALKRYEYDNTTPSASPVAIAGSITGDLYVRAGTRTYDAISASGGDYVVAFIDDTNQNINLIRYDQTHAATDTDTIVGDFYAVALAEASDGHIYVLTAETGETHQLELWHRDAALAAIWGPTLIHAFGVNESADNLGVVEGNNGSVLRAVCVWALKKASGPFRRDMYNRSTSVAGGALDTGVPVYSANPLSRPFFYRNRCYAHVGTVTDTAYDGLGFESHMLLDLDPNGSGRADGLTARMAALWGVGTYPGLSAAYNLGSVNNVWTMVDTTVCRLMCPFIAEALKAQTVGELQFSDIRVAFDDVGFTFDETPSTSPLHRGASIIGGGYVVWYDGTQTFELGFAKPPMVNATSQAAGTIPNGTYTYSNLWQHVDAAGVLHRSLPSPGKQEVLADAGGTTKVTLTAMSLPGSRRPYADMTCQWFRAGADNIPKRVNRSADNIPNTYSAKTTQTLTDDYIDARLYVSQYTVGGVLEAVAPEGARIPHVARERLWLGDFFRGDRIQYSKLVVPSTAGENAIAPELYEALGRISGDGEAITGISDMDAATVVFTKNRIYLVAGYGPDPRGAGDDTSRLTEVMTDAGCIEPRSVVQGPDGVFFQTDRGIYLLTRSMEVTPIGEPVRTLMDTYSVVTSAVVVTSERQVRFTVTNAAQNDGRILVYDYRIGAWFEWLIQDSDPSTIVPIGGAFVDDTYYIAGTDGKIRYEDKTTWYDDSVTWVPMMVETGAIQPSGPLQWIGIYNICAMCEYKDDHNLSIVLFPNHDATSGGAKLWTNAQLLALTDPDDRMHLLLKPTYPKVESMRVRITDATGGTPTNGQGFEVHGVGIELQIFGGLPRLQKEARQ